MNMNGYGSQEVKILTTLSVVDKRRYFEAMIEGAIPKPITLSSLEWTNNLNIKYVRGEKMKTISVDKL